MNPCHNNRQQAIQECDSNVSLVKQTTAHDYKRTTTQIHTIKEA